MNNFSEKVSFIWGVADLLRGDYKQSEYGRVILAFLQSGARHLYRLRGHSRPPVTRASISGARTDSARRLDIVYRRLADSAAGSGSPAAGR
jgi:hypothetical protein